jgi:hypothetical protein
MTFMRLLAYLRSGAIAGALSAVCFAFIHAWFISDIWFFAWVMVAAGALCGLCLALGYAVVVVTPTAGNWVRYNAHFVVMLAILGFLSVLFFEPVTTIAALLRLDGPPEDLFQQALPLTVAFTLVTVIVLSLYYRRGWRGFAALLLATVVLVALLGLNVSVIGLVNIPRSFLYLVFELAALVLALGLVYMALFALLEWKTFFRRGGAQPATPAPPPA